MDRQTRILSMLMLALFGLVFGISVVMAGEAEKKTSLADLAWLVGSWERQQKSSVMHERWSRVDDTLLAGDAIKIAGADTTALEKMRMLQRGAHVYFVAEVPHNDSAVFFELTRVDSLGFHFENPKHDFPTHIIYRAQSGDSLFARIEGVSDGKLQGVDFRFRRVK